MCEFKFCAGAHACFLRNVSPCPKAEHVPVTPGGTAETAARLGLRNRGFLDRDQLIAALGIDEVPQVPAEPRMVRIVSKLRIAAANIGMRAAS
jgi:hypothetical protein